MRQSQACIHLGHCFLNRVKCLYSGTGMWSAVRLSPSHNPLFHQHLHFTAYEPIQGYQLRATACPCVCSRPSDVWESHSVNETGNINYENINYITCNDLPAAGITRTAVVGAYNTNRAQESRSVCRQNDCPHSYCNVNRIRMTPMVHSFIYSRIFLLFFPPVSW